MMLLSVMLPANVLGMQHSRGEASSLILTFLNEGVGLIFKQLSWDESCLLGPLDPWTGTPQSLVMQRTNVRCIKQWRREARSIILTFFDRRGRPDIQTAPLGRILIVRTS